MIAPGPDLQPSASDGSCAASSRSTSRPASPSARSTSSSARGMRVSPSTVRSELAELERFGLLTHPHTSAGRVPTDRGYRYYVDRLLERLEPRPPSFPLDLAVARSEVESALQATTEMLSQVTRLIALVSAPPLEAATVRHVEVLLLQPQIVMVVVITSTGGVTKRRLRVRRAGRPRAREVGGRVPERAARRPLARQRASSGGASRTRRSRPPSSRSSRCSRRRSRTPTTRSSASTSAARRACSTRFATRSSALPVADRPARAPARPARPARRGARPAAAVRPRRRRARAPGPSRPRARRRRVRAREPHARRRQPGRPVAHGLREGDPQRCAPPRSELSRFVEVIYGEN